MTTLEQLLNYGQMENEARFAKVKAEWMEAYRQMKAAERAWAQMSFNPDHWDMDREALAAQVRITNMHFREMSTELFFHM